MPEKLLSKTVLESMKQSQEDVLWMYYGKFLDVQRKTEELLMATRDISEHYQEDIGVLEVETLLQSIHQEGELLQELKKAQMVIERGCGYILSLMYPMGTHDFERDISDGGIENERLAHDMSKEFIEKIDPASKLGTWARGNINRILASTEDLIVLFRETQKSQPSSSDVIQYFLENRPRYLLKEHPFFADPQVPYNLKMKILQVIRDYEYTTAELNMFLNQLLLRTKGGDIIGDDE